MIRTRFRSLTQRLRRRLRPTPATVPPTTGPTTPLRARLIFWSGVVLCLGGGLLLGFYLSFPAESLRQRLEQEATSRAGVQLRITALRPLFPPALEARDLRLRLPGAGAAAPLQIERLRLWPLWTSLVGSNPGTAFSAELLGGTLDGFQRRRGDLTLAGHDLKLALPLPRTPSLVFTANVREVSFTGAVPPLPATETRLQLRFDDCAISGLQNAGFTNDRLPLGTLTAVAGGRGNTLRIEQLTAAGGALLLTGEGTLLLASVPWQSRLNLALALRPGPGLDPALAEMLPALAQPAADGSLKLTVSGTLASPALR